MADLTFAELRLATLLHANKPVAVSGIGFKIPDLAQIIKTNHGDLENALVEMVLVADKIAATAGIDLAAAIRRRFEPPSQM